MRISQLNVDSVLKFLKLSGDEGDISPLALLAAAKSYVKSYTGLTEDEMDRHEDLAIAALILCADFYENRMTTVDSSNVNKTVDTILSMYRKNLL